ncbi:MAG: molybdopterin-dependent oxidoreductase [Deltaproteobacteria bacterium]|nr:molybdopterin-dependent oxidoreductase [Deltaproteobacteria bacterium]
MLHGAIRRSDRVHARILSIDVSAARALPGVRAVITANDIENRPFGHGRDNTPLKGDRVLCSRDEIAAVAADTEAIAREACRLIRVEYEDLAAVFSPEEALAPGAPVLYSHVPDNQPFHYDYAHGDLEAAVAESDEIVSDTYRLHYVTHCCMGTSGIVADFSAAGALTVHSSTQVPHMYRRDLAAIVGLPPEKVRVVQATIGGGFGSKLDIYPFEPICVWLARRSGRPVRLLFDREEEFVGSPTRQPAIFHMRSGARRDGTFTFRDVRIVLDNGGHTSWGATTPFVMMQTFSSLYRCKAVKVRADVVYTNNPYAGSFRGYGNPQATFALEAQVDALAARLGIDPIDLRLRNVQEPGEVTGQGMRFHSIAHKECLETVRERSSWTMKRGRPGEAHLRRGVGVASLLHVGGGAKMYRTDGCGTTLKLDDFGIVHVTSGSSEIGQGSDTVLAQCAAEAMGVRLEHVRVHRVDTDLGPWDVGVHASRTTFIAGNSVLMAAREAKKKLLGAASAQVRRPVERLDVTDSEIVDLETGQAVSTVGKVVRALHFRERGDVIMTSAYYEPPSQAQDEGYKGDVSATYAFGAQVAEVEVDVETGVVRLVRLTAAHDVGRAINRLGIEGQIEGGIAMGAGYALTEELKVSRGVVENPRFRDYHLVTAPEIPEIDVTFVEQGDREGPFGAKGVGEAPLIPVAAAIAAAVEDATGVRFTSLPLTPERVLAGLRERS